MNELVNFVKGIIMPGCSDKSPVGLCAFEHSAPVKTRKIKQQRKKEMRLSELMDR